MPSEIVYYPANFEVHEHKAWKAGLSDVVSEALELLAGVSGAVVE